MTVPPGNPTDKREINADAPAPPPTGPANDQEAGPVSLAVCVTSTRHFSTKLPGIMYEYPSFGMENRILEEGCTVEPVLAFTYLVTSFEPRRDKMSELWRTEGTPTLGAAGVYEKGTDMSRW